MKSIIKIINQNLDVLPIIILIGISLFLLYIFFKSSTSKAESNNPETEEDEKETGERICSRCWGEGCFDCDYYGTVNN